MMIGVCGQREVTGEINFYPVALANGDGGQNIEEFIQDALRGLAHAFANTCLHALDARLSQKSA